MRFLRPAYVYLRNEDDVVKMGKFLDLFKKVDLKDDDFHIDNFPPGTGGESKLFHTLMQKSGLDGYS